MSKSKIEGAIAEVGELEQLIAEAGKAAKASDELLAKTRSVVLPVIGRLQKLLHTALGGSRLRGLKNLGKESARFYGARVLSAGIDEKLTRNARALCINEYGSLVSATLSCASLHYVRRLIPEYGDRDDVWSVRVVEVRDYDLDADVLPTYVSTLKTVLARHIPAAQQGSGRREYVIRIAEALNQALGSEK